MNDLFNVFQSSEDFCSFSAKLQKDNQTINIAANGRVWNYVIDDLEMLVGFGYIKWPAQVFTILDEEYDQYAGHYFVPIKERL